MVFYRILVLVDRAVGCNPPFRVINRFQVQRARAALGAVFDAVRVVLGVAGGGGRQHEFGEFLPGEVVEQAVFAAGIESGKAGTGLKYVKELLFVCIIRTVL